jgi:hypothetical protein
VGAGDERRDVRIGKITLSHGGKARNGSVIVSCTGGCIGIGVLCWRLKHLVEKGRSQVVDEMTLRLIEFHQCPEEGTCYQCAYCNETGGANVRDK